MKELNEQELNAVNGGMKKWVKEVGETLKIVITIANFIKIFK